MSQPRPVTERFEVEAVDAAQRVVGRHPEHEVVPPLDGFDAVADPTVATR